MCKIFTLSFLTFPSQQEIQQTLWSIHPLKSPGPDGLHAHFFHNMWNILNSDIVHFTQTIFLTTRITHDLTKIKLILIPKVPNPETLSQFRPHSCM